MGLYTATSPSKPVSQALKNNRLSRKNGITDSYRLIKYGIWMYFILLIFEGALRKWFLPELATPLLIIRDPLALWLIVVTWKRGLLNSNVYLIGVVGIGILGIFTATLLSHGNLAVALFGARVLLLHFPLIFVIGRIFNREDVVRMGKVTLWISIPMVILIALQFYSPQTSWVNRGVGGDMAGAGFSGAMGFFRPPGTFSFTNGNAAFFGFVAAYIIYFWLNRKTINNLILITATIALLFAIPLSISRTLLFQVAISLSFAIIAISRKPEYFGKLLIAIIGGAAFIFIMSKFSLFETATEVFSNRFENANESEGGLEGVFIDRFLGGLIGALMGASDLPFWGYGLGMGTNVGSMLLAGKRAFLIAEGEWGRLVGELGLLIGIGVIIIRLGFTAQLTFACYKKLVQGDLLPWMLLSFGLLNLTQGGWAQPTSLGFCTIIGGLILASFRRPILNSVKAKVPALKK